MTRGLDVLFAEVLERYPSVRRGEKFGRESSFWPLIREVHGGLEAALASVGAARVKVKVSFGQGGWAEVPNFAVMDTRETSRPSAGVYVVYLVRADASGIVLSLNQGSADLFLEARGKAPAILAGRAERLRAVPALAGLDARGFTGGPIDLRSTGQYPRAYAAGNIFSKVYQAGALPEAAELAADLGAVQGAYAAMVPSRRWAGGR